MIHRENGEIATNTGNPASSTVRVFGGVRKPFLISKRRSTNDFKVYGENGEHTKSVDVGVLGIHRDTQNGYPMNDTGTIRTGKKSFDSVIPVLMQQNLTETSVLHTM